MAGTFFFLGPRKKKIHFWGLLLASHSINSMAGEKFSKPNSLPTKYTTQNTYEAHSSEIFQEKLHQKFLKSELCMYFLEKFLKSEVRNVCEFLKSELYMYFFEKFLKSELCMYFLEKFLKSEVRNVCKFLRSELYMYFFEISHEWTQKRM